MYKKKNNFTHSNDKNVYTLLTNKHSPLSHPTWLLQKLQYPNNIPQNSYIIADTTLPDSKKSAKSWLVISYNLIKESRESQYQ